MPCDLGDITASSQYTGYLDADAAVPVKMNMVVMRLGREGMGLRQKGIVLGKGRDGVETK